MIQHRKYLKTVGELDPTPPAILKSPNDSEPSLNIINKGYQSSTFLQRVNLVNHWIMGYSTCLPTTSMPLEKTRGLCLGEASCWRTAGMGCYSSIAGWDSYEFNSFCPHNSFGCYSSCCKLLSLNLFGRFVNGYCSFPPAARKLWTAPNFTVVVSSKWLRP